MPKTPQSELTPNLIFAIISSYEVPQDKLEIFLKEIGAHGEPQARLRLTTKDVPAETTVVILERQ